MSPLTTAYLLFALVLVTGLFVYEARGWRLGGVLVAPLLALYTYLDPLLLIVFAGAAILSGALGLLARQRWFLYGRRLLALHILFGLVGSLLLIKLLPVTDGSVALPVLPGIFAYNMHREQGLVAPLVRFIVLLASVLVLVTLLGDAPQALAHTLANGSDAVAAGQAIEPAIGTSADAGGIVAVSTSMSVGVDAE